jgi:hypothetical protein
MRKLCYLLEITVWWFLLEEFFEIFFHTVNQMSCFSGCDNIYSFCLFHSNPQTVGKYGNASNLIFTPFLFSKKKKILLPNWLYHEYTFKQISNQIFKFFIHEFIHWKFKSTFLLNMKEKLEIQQTQSNI